MTYKIFQSELDFYLTGKKHTSLAGYLTEMEEKGIVTLKREETGITVTALQEEHPLYVEYEEIYDEVYEQLIYIEFLNDR
jgi:hypothetical protein